MFELLMLLALIGTAIGVVSLARSAVQWFLGTGTPSHDTQATDRNKPCGAQDDKER